MTKDFSHILLFKTDLNCEEDKRFVHSILDKNPQIRQWNLDLDDEDYVLRIISYTLTHEEIIQLLNQHGRYCHILI
jgi:hypothetical protein